MKTIVKISNLSKRFRSVEALKGVNIELKQGEIHGLIGANGSGKSTLLNILFGNLLIKETGGYSGEILIDGQVRNICSPSSAIKCGIGMIHQEFALISHMSVAENIKINRENVYDVTEKIFRKDFACVDKKKNTEDAKNVLERLGIELDTSIKIIDLSTNMKQFIEIAREIDKDNLKLLLLDEPTAVLNKEDSNKLISILKDISKRGTVIIYVSHRLEEIISLCDSATVLRDGEVVGRYKKEEFSIEKIAEDMIGHKVVKVYKEKKKTEDNKVISFKDFSVNMPGEAIHNINLDINQGEIIGVTGLAGHGKLALGCGVMGMYKTEGFVLYKDQQLDINDTGKLIEKGIYMLPDDRKNLGLLLNHSVMENVIFTAMQNKNKFLKIFPWKCFSVLNKSDSKEYLKACVEKFNIKCSSASQKVKELSGGNQQKVCIARALAIDPEVLFVAEPTRGVDIAAKERILDMLLSINKEKHTTIIVASSELEELKRICDRIVVMYEGKIFEILPPECDDKTFALAFSGERSSIYE